MKLRIVLSLFLLTSVGCVVEEFDLAGEPNEELIAFSYNGAEFNARGYMHGKQDRDIWVLDFSNARRGGIHTVAAAMPPHSQGFVQLCLQGTAPGPIPVVGCEAGTVVCRPDGTGCLAAAQVSADPKSGVDSLVVLFDLIAAPQTAYGFQVSSTYE